MISLPPSSLIRLDSNTGEAYYRQIYARLRSAVADGLLQPGDRIAIQMPNVLQFPIAVFGAIRAGLVVVNTNPLYTAREMRHQFKDSGARALIYMNMFGHLVQEVLPDTEIKYLFEARMGDMLPGLKGMLVNAAVKHVKKMVPSYSLPQAISFKAALKRSKGQRARCEGGKRQQDSA